ncbi:MAG: hypothetical protein JO225_16355 [Candidatus Eremiobacteraeota bacterium]|nr:hypothetical protein [Candidatus Eremiobacteraeota bacterium]
MIVQSPLQVGAALRGLLLAFALVVRLRDRGRSAEDGAKPDTAEAAAAVSAAQDNFGRHDTASRAGSAGLAEQLIRNQQVGSADSARSVSTGYRRCSSGPMWTG